MKHSKLKQLIEEALQPKKSCSCGCGTCDNKAPMLTESKVKNLLSEGLQHHIDNKIPLHETIYRFGSDKHLSLIRESRRLYSRGVIDIHESDKQLMETHLGEFALYEGETIPLDLPMLNEEKVDEAQYKGKDVPIGKPKRGGSKAYYVYVKDGDKVKKVSFGSGGLRAKIKNKEARNAFAARHDCKNKKDRTKAGYWSCNLPRYADALGLGSKMNTYW